MLNTFRGAVNGAIKHGAALSYDLAFINGFKGGENLMDSELSEKAEGAEVDGEQGDFRFSHGAGGGEQSAVSAENDDVTGAGGGDAITLDDGMSGGVFSGLRIKQSGVAAGSERT